ncbi:hypothetical protein QYM36_011413 [Artemia franciscana]|uniref:Uncharacterized protein n=1 Tax=Artemia franciscana TaxID=6661 RepID=A0AA88HNG2_ARTSF|nr:hypothetical protein QYM36_011413 [Artemia franciscana]
MQGGKSSRIKGCTPDGAAMIIKGGVAFRSVTSDPPGLHPGQLNKTTPEQNFVACDICDSSFTANGSIKVWVSGLLPKHERVLYQKTLGRKVNEDQAHVNSGQKFKTSQKQPKSYGKFLEKMSTFKFAKLFLTQNWLIRDLNLGSNVP